jgi:phospholipase C
MSKAINSFLRATLVICAAFSASTSALRAQNTTTPIKYVVVIFDENNSFDHYFGAYPNAMNLPGETPFIPLPNTPGINGLSFALLNHSPSLVPPFRLSPAMALTCDNDNHYSDEQKADDSGKVDEFALDTSATGASCTPDLSMGYYDGNTVAALWNYAQYFAMSDNYFDTEFGTTVMGHLNLISGQTHTTSVTSISAKVANGTVIANVEAGFDDCVTTSNGTPVQMTSTNIGDLLNANNVTWGWFYADFPESTNNQPITTCPSTYNSHYDPFQYYQSTSNIHHLPPSSVSAIGTSADQANHQYSLADFWNAVDAGNIPSVTFLKAAKPQTGHPADSTPLAEQTFLVSTINQLQATPFWNQMAIFITYDDSDGWYDHVMPPIVNQSNDPAADFVGGAGLCGVPQPGAYLDRCGYGTRLPLIAISPYAKQNYVDHAITDTTSVTRFIEDNWNLGRLGDQSFDGIANSLKGLFDFSDTPRSGRELILDPTTGVVVTSR